MNREGFRIWMVLALLVLCQACWGAEGSATTNTAPSSEDLLRSYLRIQEQLRIMQLNLDKGRQEAESAAIKAGEALNGRLQEAESAATKTGEALNGRLQAIEQSLSAQRSRELETLQNTNRTILVAAGIFAAIGCLTVLGMAWFQWRTVNKLAEISAVLPRMLPAGMAYGALGQGEETVLSVSRPAEESGARLLGTLERLEQRILELEQTTSAGNTPVLADRHAAAFNGEDKGHSNGREPEDRLRSLLGKGQSLMNLDQAEEALGCFEEILGVKPDHTEALMKKAMALEKLGRLDAAIATCDQAIASDRTSTVAYLYKGGLFNRVERFQEALQCYEQALQAQEKNRSRSLPGV